MPEANKRRSPSVDELVNGVLARDRAIIGRTLTLMESAHPAHRKEANVVLQRLLPHSGSAMRVGISGVPGSGKSTLIETLGIRLTEAGNRVAVLAVDPSSEISGGSILGDKTRMERLARSSMALVRPTASGAVLGGVARGTRESIIVCEAAGYDVVLVETVGVGQSETQVASMVDFFLLLLIAGAGDELQGIKRGIIELADSIAINKADGENMARAQAARSEFENALRLVRPPSDEWQPRAFACSAVTGDGVDAIWNAVREHRAVFELTGQLRAKRQNQALYWMKQTLERLVIEDFYRHPKVAEQIGPLRREVLDGTISPFFAAETLVGLHHTAKEE